MDEKCKISTINFIFNIQKIFVSLYISSHADDVTGSYINTFFSSFFGMCLGMYVCAQTVELGLCLCFVNLEH